MTDDTGTTWAHGASGYGNHDCRCDVCRAGHAAAMQKHRASRIARLRVDPTLTTHGRPSTYSNWGCRCDACRDAWSTSERDRYARRTGKVATT